MSPTRCPECGTWFTGVEHRCMTGVASSANFPNISNYRREVIVHPSDPGEIPVGKYLVNETLKIPAAETVAEVVAKRRSAWAETEPCNRCGGRNVNWAAPSPLWNLVMRGGSIDGPWKYAEIICIACFFELAADAGVAGRWRVSVDPEPEGMETVTPSGRTWNPVTWMWDESDRICGEEFRSTVYTYTCVRRPGHPGEHDTKREVVGG